MLAVGLDCYKWYQSQTLSDVLVEGWAPKEGGHEVVCQWGRWALKEGGLWDPTLVGEENETFFIRVWKLLPNKRVSKILRGSSKGKAQRGQYLLVVDLGCYKWYKNQTPGDVLVEGWAPKEGGHEAVCQWGRWASKEDGLWDPTSVGEENKTLFIRVWKPLPSRRVSKILRGSSKGKAQRRWTWASASSSASAWAVTHMLPCHYICHMFYILWALPQQFVCFFCLASWLHISITPYNASYFKKE